MSAQPSSPCYSGGPPAFAGEVSLYYHVGKTPLAWPVHASAYPSEMGQNWSEPPILENGGLPEHEGRANLVDCPLISRCSARRGACQIMLKMPILPTDDPSSQHKQNNRDGSQIDNIKRWPEYSAEEILMIFQR